METKTLEIIAVFFGIIAGLIFLFVRAKKTGGDFEDRDVLLFISTSALMAEIARIIIVGICK